MKEAYKLLHYGSLALARAERQGIRIDLDKTAKTKKNLTDMIDGLTADFKRSAFYKDWIKSLKGKTPNEQSNPQLGKYLYDHLGLKPIKQTASGQGSTDQEALEALDIPALNGLLRIRKLKKLRDTYLEQFTREAVDGIIHPGFNLNTVDTYRSSSSEPNFQNIPNRDEESRSIIRSCLYPRRGNHLLEVDYSQLEVRVAACYHKDPTMLNYINDKTTDMHRDMCEDIFMLDKFDKANKGHKILRGATKNGFVFPQFYGDYYVDNALTLAKWTGLPINRAWKSSDGLDIGGLTIGEHLKSHRLISLKRFETHLKRIEDNFWGERFPVYDQWRARWWKRYQRKGYFDTLTGFRCQGVMRRNEAVNYPIQGSAFHCLLWSFIELDRLMLKEHWDTRLIGQIHDAIILDVPPQELDYVLETIQRVMTQDVRDDWKWIIVPLDIEAELSPVDGSWYDKKEIQITA